MVYTNLKNTAIELRRQGLSFSEIKEKVPVSKATLSKWFKEIKLSPVQRSRLKQKRIEAAKRGAEKKVAKTLEQIEKIQKNSKREIGKISKKELWLMGVILYWKSSHKTDLKKGVHFTSSDPDQIKLFLKWLYEVGGLKDEEFIFDIFLTGNGDFEEAVNYWAEVTSFSRDSFPHLYKHKKRPTTGKRKIQKSLEKGMLRVRVRSSSMLARQINGWIEGLKEVLN